MKLLIFDDMNCCTEEEVQRMLPLVSEQRRKQALHFKHLFGRFACLKSYEMLMQCVKNVMSDEKEALSFKNSLKKWNGKFVYNEHGKPFLQDGEQKGPIKDVDFSISHCKNGIAVVLANHAVGVDIENFRHAEDSLLRKTMCEQEIAAIKSSDMPVREFTCLWTKKEALLKMLGTGLVDELPELLNTSIAYASSMVKTIVNEEYQYVYTLITTSKILEGNIQ